MNQMKTRWFNVFVSIILWALFLAGGMQISAAQAQPAIPPLFPGGPNSGLANIQTIGVNPLAPVEPFAVPSECLSTEEAELVGLINEYRNDNGLADVPASSSLTLVAQWHVIDLDENNPDTGEDHGYDCNMHSWSDQRPDLWSAVCYTGDHYFASGMWDKPEEITKGIYTGNGFENAYWSSGQATASGALNGWKNSSAHNDVILEQGMWSGKDWPAMGVGIYEHYAVLWFGDQSDPQGDVTPCQVQSQYSVSGQVTDSSSNPISGVTISDGAGHTDTTDTYGDYTLSGLSAGTYTITPSKSGTTFSPTSRQVSVPPDATGVDFTGGAGQTYSISGRVIDGSSNPIYGVTISDGAGHTDTTDTNGEYTLTGLSAGTLTLTPSKSGYIFSPSQFTVTVPSSGIIEQQFTVQEVQLIFLPFVVR